MNRALKFRLWDDKNKQWMHGPNVDNSLDGCHILGETMLFGEFAPVSLERLNDLVVLQYTGTNDMYGKNIFEGDIVECEFESYDSDGDCRTYFEKGKVTMNLGQWVAENQTNHVMFPIYGNEKQIEIIGNIYNNKDARLVENS